MKKEITQAELKEIVSYDQGSGKFVWKIRRGGSAKKGSICGSIDSEGYRKICIFRKIYYAHRLAWLYVYGESPKKNIDHINRIKEDNRIKNLRDVSRSDNMRNCKMKNNNTSGVTGVCWHKASKKWKATIGDKYLGIFNNIEDAKTARLEQEEEIGYAKNHGKHKI